jgi:hypothetical protein
MTTMLALSTHAPVEYVAMSERTVTITMHVQLILVMLKENVSTPRSAVMITMHVLLTLVMQLKDVFILLLLI